MYNLRYHIASLVSVFLALALGLVLGGLAVGQGAMQRQETVLVEGLQKEFAQLREENRLLAAENGTLNDFVGETVDRWAVDRLKGQTVVVLASAGRSDGVVDAREAIERAGGTVAVVTLLQPRFGLDDDQIASQIATLAASDDPEASIAASIAAEWSTGGPRPVTETLIDAGVLRVDDLPVGTPASSLVLVATSDGEPDSGGLSIARSFSSPAGVALGAETPGSGTGVAAAASGADMPALDTLGTEVGSYTLISLLSGAEPGYYGTGAGADRGFPPFAAE